MVDAYTGRDGTAFLPVKGIANDPCIKAPSENESSGRLENGAEVCGANRQFDWKLAGRKSGCFQLLPATPLTFPAALARTSRSLD